MRVGVLTGGGDAPGLNCVIRAVVRRGVTDYGMEFVGFADGWHGPLTGRHQAARRQRGPRDPAAWRDDPRFVAHEPAQAGGWTRRGPRHDRRPRRRRTDRHRWRGHPRRRRQAVRGRSQRRRRAEDDRQRPGRDRRHVRIRHCRADRHRRHRPAAHDRRVAQADAGARGDGSPRGLDRAALRHGRRRQRHLDPRAELRHGRSGRLGRGAVRAWVCARSSWSPRALFPPAARWC